ncbi:MAG TPA: PPOX class F420-dependent oxidoreductase [Actinomycetes bacterium]|jgi:pyridoxamine 5'-phosphate oxidase family protein|nr:PPOX class F420-dependent oxidoreductase [Actinomycetes bacterium]
MATFTDAEVDYLSGQPLARLATVGADGRPHVMPVGFFYEPETQAIVIGSGGEMAASKKFRDVQRRPDVALVVDDLASMDPWTPRGIEIRGRAEAFASGGEEVGKRLGARFPFNRAWIRVRPRRVLAWGIEGSPYGMSARDVA